MKTRHHNNNIVSATTGFARRALLLVAFLVASVGSVWGQTVIWGETEQATSYIDNFGIDYFGKFTEYSSNTAMRIYVSSDGYLYMADGNWNPILDTKNITTEHDGTQISPNSGYFNDEESCYELPMATVFNKYTNNISDFISALTYGKMIIQTKNEYNQQDNNRPITKIVILNLAPDTFEDPDKSPKSTGIDFTKYLTNQSPIPTLDIKKAIALLDEAKPTYARFYVLHNGEPLDLSKNPNLLTIEGVSLDKQSPKKGIYGYYLYDFGNELELENISVKLNAEAGKFPEYQVICVLSTSQARTAEGNTVTEEPSWDVMFTYAFRNQVETKNYTGEVAWDAVAMAATIPANNITEYWGTSWANLAQEQKIQWYVTDGTSEEPLTIGTERQNDTWTINLPVPFSMNGNIATLTGQTTYNAASFESLWETWGNPVIYAPANKSFADVQNYKIICKIADDAEDQALPNVIYTFSLTNTFPGQEKTTIVKDTKQAKATANETSATINLTLPEGTKYARFYVVDQNGTIVDAPWLTVNGGTTIYNQDITGTYVYNENGLTLSSVTVTGNEANLDEYQVIMITSSETAVASGSTVTYEPDYENQTTFWLNYPATLWETSGNVEWSPQSMQIVAPDIEGDEAPKGKGYLDKNKQHYTLQWTIVNGSDEEQPVRIGDSRVEDEWSINVSNNPFTVEGTVVTVSNNSDFCLAAWNKWVAPQIYAPKNMTMKQITDAGIKFVCKLYEADEAGDDDMLAMTYTVYIDRTEVLGQLKDGGLYSEELVKGIKHEATTHDLNLGNAITAYHEKFDGKKVTYVRVYLTKNDGTALDPTGGDEKFVVEGYSNHPHIFENHKEYGYYFQIEKDINLDALAHITLPVEGIFTYYNVVVAMSGDTDAAEHTEGMGSLFQQRAASVMSAYEPDFDYIYTYKFAETSSFPGSLDNLQYNHSKEVLVKANETKVLIPLNDDKTVAEFVSELGKSSFTELVNDYFHVRWFVAKKNPDGTYEKLPGSENMLKAVEAGTEHWTEDNQGIYWNSEVSSETNQYTYVDRILKVNFEKPDGGNWADYQVVVWMTNDSERAEKNKNGPALSTAPQNIKIQYIYNFFEEENWKFVHYKGASGRDYMTVNAEDPNYRDSRIDAVGSPLTQYDWDNATSTAFATTEDIRQSVHTVEYELYVGDEDVELSLPFEENNSLEPTAYIRWYDYTTDLNTSMLDPKGNQLHCFEESLADENKQDRGWFHLDTKLNASNSSSTAIGMKFKGGVLNENETAVIACDISKYFDGSYQSTTSQKGGLIMLHEPTLSVRYIFTIRRAKTCADSIKEKADVFEEAIQGLKDGTVKYSKVRSTMFNLFENNGRTVVSLNGTSGEFSLRTKLSNLGYYQIYNTNGSSIVECKNIDWYAYYENEKGLYYKSSEWAKDESKVTNNGFRICDVKFDDNLKGHYRLLSDNSDLVKVETIKGTIIHMIGYLKNGDTKAAAIHYELNFIDAPAIPVLELRTTTDETLLARTQEYLDAKLLPAGAVTFDDKFLKEDGSINYDRPTVWEENIREMPLEWSEAEYSFCYPSIDAYRQDNEWTGFTAQHGDYMLLKSMQLKDVSESISLKRFWYYTYNYPGTPPTLRDYTYTYKHGNDEANSDYGGFFYVDASDEARTVANLKFSASLCRGSEIHFTMAVADVTETGKTVAPQLVAHVYEMTEDGKKGQLVISFVACTLNNDIIKGGDKKLATWYQYYGYGSIPSNIELDGTNKNFIVEIDNNCQNTNGADFCVDEIRFYTLTTKLKVKQGAYDCDNDETKTNLYLTAEDIEAYKGQMIYWRICDENNQPVLENDSHSLYQNGGKNYGQIRLPVDVPSSVPSEKDDFTSGYFTGTDGVLYFSLTNRPIALEEGKEFYVSVYNLAVNGEPAGDDDDLWGSNKNACDVYSHIFIPQKMYITVTNGEGKDNSVITMGCGTSSASVSVDVVLHVPDETEPTGFKSYTNFEFDYFLGSLEEYKNFGDEKYKLYDALKAFRNKDEYKDKEYTTYDELPDICKTGEYAVIGEAVQQKLLYLSCKKNISNLNITTEAKTILAIPIAEYVTVTDRNDEPRKDDQGKPITVDICDPFEFTFTIISGEGGGPTLDLGFHDVTYPEDYTRVVRVGLGQINNMKKDYLLHIPVNTFKTDESAEAKTGTLIIVSDYLELWKDSQTTDSKVTQKMNVATFEEDEINADDKMYISVNFHGAGVEKTDFYEGFTYHMFFKVQKKDAGEGACTGNVEFLMKVVPEYVTWNDNGKEVTPNSNLNTNWNNDANWSRSKKAELHKTETNSDGYQNNGTDTESGDNGVASTPATFVPMKFTYVTIPSGNRAPVLEKLIIGNDGIYTATSMGDGATENIQYDLMVRMEEECLDSKHNVSPKTNIYDCEKFYGNWAKEIYFKPGAELVHQQYLTYEKVWVEKELTAGTWTLMSTPLQNTYAGDMYVPTDGQQKTEAFQPITFVDTANDGIYSRTAYPIYQKSWLQEGSKVYTMTNDVQRTDYSANIIESVATTLSQWSHTYNDVTVDYSQWKGFAVRAHKSDYTDYTGTRNNALIRLPKEDTQYDYYKWDGNIPTEDGKLDEQVVNKKADNDDNQNHLATGKLFTDKIPNTYGLTYGVDYQPTANDNEQFRTADDGTVNVPIGEVQDAKTNNIADYYLLVGNPYLCSINMEEFFADEGNKGILNEGYWTYEQNTIINPYKKGSIKPLQAFFVKLKENVTDGNKEIRFTPAMMIDGNTNSIVASVRAMMMTAANNRGQSSATISVGEEAKSVETLFDSNLEDVPMVYTVADSRAVSINQVAELSAPIAFGVTCTASNEPVAVTFSDIAQLTSGEVYVVDAVTGERTLVTEGATLSVQPNDYGRYFLLAGMLGISDKADVQKGIVVSVRGKDVTVTSADDLTVVRAFSASGTTVYQDTTSGTSKSFTLVSGVYVIQAENAAGEQQTVKVVIKI